METSPNLDSKCTDCGPRNKSRLCGEYKRSSSLIVLITVGVCNDNGRLRLLLFSNHIWKWKFIKKKKNIENEKPIQSHVTI